MLISIKHRSVTDPQEAARDARLPGIHAAAFAARYVIEGQNGHARKRFNGLEGLGRATGCTWSSARDRRRAEVDLSELTRSIQSRLDAKNEARERPSRRASLDRASANSIRATHRLEFDTAQELIGSRGRPSTRGSPRSRTTRTSATPATSRTPRRSTPKRT